MPPLPHEDDRIIIYANGTIHDAPAQRAARHQQDLNDAAALAWRLRYETWQREENARIAAQPDSAALDAGLTEDKDDE
jgi:hypothetical protein